MTTEVGPVGSKLQKDWEPFDNFVTRRIVIVFCLAIEESLTPEDVWPTELWCPWWYESPTGHRTGGGLMTVGDKRSKRREKVT